MGAGGIGGEPVAGGHPAGAIGDSGGIHGGLGGRQVRRGELNLVDGGHQSHGIADGGGVHIVLHEALRQNDGADGDILEAAGHTGVQHQIRVVEADEQLGAHGGVDLADAAAAGDDMGADLIKGHARLRADGSAGLVCQQRLYFAGHGVYQTNGHDGVPP